METGIDIWIRQAEDRWLDLLYSNAKRLFRKNTLPSHDHSHHMRVWNLSKSLLREISTFNPGIGRSLVEGVLIAAFFHDGCIDLIGFKQLDSLLPDILRLAHRHPHIGIEKITTLDALAHVVGYGNFGACIFSDLFCLGYQLFIRLDAFGGHGSKIHTHFGCSHQ